MADFLTQHGICERKRENELCHLLKPTWPMICAIQILAPLSTYL